MQFETEQLPAFLAHIANDEARELERLRSEYETEARAVRAEARRASRQFHRRVAEETRTRIGSDHQRKLSRAQNEFRRRRWQALTELRDKARARIQAGLRECWDDPAKQLSWCRYWLDTCECLGDGEDVEVRISADAAPSTIDAVRELIGQGRGGAGFSVDETMSEGILIRHGARSIDGMLRTQVEPLLESINRELAGWVHREDDDSEVGI